MTDIKQKQSLLGQSMAPETSEMSRFTTIYVEEGKIQRQIVSLIAYWMNNQTSLWFIKVNDEVEQSKEYQERLKKVSNPDKALPFAVLPNGDQESIVSGYYNIACHFAANQNDPKVAALVGNNDQEKKAINEWFDYLQNSLMPCIEAAEDLDAENEHQYRVLLDKWNDKLLLTSFLALDRFTVADLVLYPITFRLAQDWDDEVCLDWCNISRWFDFVQHLPQLRSNPEFNEIFPVLYIHQIQNSWAFEALGADLEPMDTTDDEPVVEKAPTSQSKPAKAETAPASDEPPTQESVMRKLGLLPEKTESTPSKEEAKPEQKKKKKELTEKQLARKEANKSKQNKGKQAAVAAPVDVSRIKIMVGQIKKVRVHETADKLYVEDIDLGEESTRQIVSGLRLHMKMEEMQDRLVLVVGNMKSVKMVGVPSAGMVLCATSADGKVEFVDPPKGAKIGEVVTFEGYTGQPDDVLNPKKKVFDQVHLDFTTNEKLIATYKGVPFMTSAGPCTVQSVIGGTIR